MDEKQEEKYGIDGLIGMLNLGLIIQKGKNEPFVSIPKEGAIELLACLEQLDALIKVVST